MNATTDIRKSCETCLYLATHDKCDGCLGTGEPYDYKNWTLATFGQAMALEHERQVSGERNIVIGGQGEAEVNARWTVKEAYEHLVHVSSECGYLTSAPKFDADEACIRIICHSEWFLFWKAGAFDRIEERSGRCHWSRHPDFLKVKYRKESLEGYGFPRGAQHSGSCACIPKPAQPGSAWSDQDAHNPSPA